MTPALMLQVMSLYDSLDPCGNPPPPSFVSRVSTNIRRRFVSAFRAHFSSDDLDPEIVLPQSKRRSTFFANSMPKIREHQNSKWPNRPHAGEPLEAYAYHKSFVEHSPGLVPAPRRLARIQSGANLDAPRSSPRQPRSSRPAVTTFRKYSAMWILLLDALPFHFHRPRSAELKANPDTLRPQEIIMLRHTRPFKVWEFRRFSVPGGFHKKTDCRLDCNWPSAPWHGNRVATGGECLRAGNKSGTRRGRSWQETT